MPALRLAGRTARRRRSLHLAARKIAADRAVRARAAIWSELLCEKARYSGRVPSSAPSRSSCFSSRPVSRWRAPGAWRLLPGLAAHEYRRHDPGRGRHPRERGRARPAGHRTWGRGWRVPPAAPGWGGRVRDPRRVGAAMGRLAGGAGPHRARPAPLLGWDAANSRPPLLQLQASTA